MCSHVVQALLQGLIDSTQSLPKDVRSLKPVLGSPPSQHVIVVNARSRGRTWVATKVPKKWPHSHLEVEPGKVPAGCKQWGPVAGHDRKVVPCRTMVVHPLVTLKAARRQTCEVLASTTRWQSHKRTQFVSSYHKTNWIVKMGKWLAAGQLATR